jgi:hypothetical protein
LERKRTYLRTVERHSPQKLMLDRMRKLRRGGFTVENIHFHI